ncbi:MAG: hypothetical protein ACO1OF_16490 [Adhaeribacter sp.]
MKTAAEMNLVERVKAPTPKFFQKVQKAVVKIVAVAGAVLGLAAAGKVNLPGKAGNVLEIIVVAGTAIGAASQAAVDEKERDNDE